MAAVSLRARQSSAVRRFWLTSRSYRVLKPRLHSGAMFDINPEHAIGLIAGLVALPVALLLLRRQRGWEEATGTAQGAAVLMAVTGAVHLALIGHHLRTEPVTSLLFLVNAALFFGLALNMRWRHWRLASWLLLIATIAGYLVYVVGGLEGPDQVGLATKLVELTALGLVLVPARRERRSFRRTRCAALGVSLPLLLVSTTATLWIVDLVRPDARHIHAGAVLQATDLQPTQQQREAAAELYRQTKSAVAPYQDWHNAWAAGYRPGGSQTMPSTHWMNQRYIDAGYVMDPRHPQGLVYANTNRGPVLLGAMFQMKRIGEFGPDPGGAVTAWHQHQNICFTPLGFEFSLMTPTATCPLGAIDISAPAMLHVWIVDNPTGPFAIDIDPTVVKKIDQG